MRQRGIASLASLSDTHQMLQQTCRDFADNELVPNAATYDRDHIYPADKIQLMGKLGLMSMSVPEQLGIVEMVLHILVIK